MHSNTQYKDSVFTLLFSQKDKLLALYNALSGESLGADTKIEINTLRDALYKDKINDLSFVVNDKVVVLVEHQSTINENMPLRLLQYIARVYEKITDKKAQYGASLIKIPTPEFYVFYNGKAPMPPRKVLRLSDSFIELKDKLNLELVVDVYNINLGEDGGILSRDRILWEYSWFIAKVREEQAGGLELGEAIKAAIRACIKAGVLADFLRSHGSEVENMLFGEWNWEDALAYARQEAWQGGRQEEREASLQREQKIQKQYQSQIQALQDRIRVLEGR